MLALGAFVVACSEPPTTPDLATLSVSELDFAASRSNSGETIYGLASGNEFITFNAGKSNQTSISVIITWLAAGESAVGFDFRPSDRAPTASMTLGNCTPLPTRAAFISSIPSPAWPARPSPSCCRSVQHPFSSRAHRSDAADLSQHGRESRSVSLARTVIQTVPGLPSNQGIFDGWRSATAVRTVLRGSAGALLAFRF